MPWIVKGSRAQRTEDGSHASDNVHLAGIESATTDHVVQLFCMKMTFPKENDFDWMPGLFTRFYFSCTCTTMVLSFILNCMTVVSGNRNDTSHRRYWYPVDIPVPVL